MFSKMLIMWLELFFKNVVCLDRDIFENVIHVDGDIFKKPVHVDGEIFKTLFIWMETFLESREVKIKFSKISVYMWTTPKVIPSEGNDKSKSKHFFSCFFFLLPC